MSRLQSPVRATSDPGKEYPGADKLATEVVMNVLRTESLVSAGLTEVLRKHGLSLATFSVLMILKRAGRPLCPFEIGDRLLVTRGTVTGLLDSLEKKKLINRGPHPDDRRMLLVDVTENALELLSDLLPEHFPNEAEMMAALSEREKETLIRLLGKIQAHLVRQPVGASS